MTFDTSKAAPPAALEGSASLGAVGVPGEEEGHTLKLHVFARSAVAAFILAGMLVTLAGPAAAGPIEDIYRDVVEPLPGQILDAIDGACETANCEGIDEEIANIEQGMYEDLEFLTEEFPCELPLCNTTGRVNYEIYLRTLQLAGILNNQVCDIPGVCGPEGPPFGPVNLCWETESPVWCS